MGDKDLNLEDLERKIKEYEKKGKIRNAVELALKHDKLDVAAAIHIRRGDYFEAADLYRANGEIKKAEFYEEMEKKMEPHPMMNS